MARVRVKICGVTSETDALAAVEAGADAIGFNFYLRSPRFIPEEKAARIMRLLPPFVDPVALFANDLFANILAQVRRLPSIVTIQVHGDVLAPCPVEPYRFVPAFAVQNEDSLTRITAYLERCRHEGQLPAAILVDAHVPGMYGGTGQTAPWQLLADFTPGVPMILAGGLTAENVVQAVRIVRPYAWT
jgi:phosphoribosylanthranilate isomerase